MTKSLLPAGVINTMAYEPGGLRVRLEESTGVKQFVWDDQNYLQQTDASGTPQVDYTTEPNTYGPLISHRKSGSTTSYHDDALGSTRALTDASESILETYNYSAWGHLLGTPTLLTPFLWIGSLGYHWDTETQTQYIRARYYRPTIARWLSKDPAKWPFFLPLYTYGDNSPLVLIDSTGLFAQHPCSDCYDIIHNEEPEEVKGL